LARQFVARFTISVCRSEIGPLLWPRVGKFKLRVFPKRTSSEQILGRASCHLASEQARARKTKRPKAQGNLNPLRASDLIRSVASIAFRAFQCGCGAGHSGAANEFGRNFGPFVGGRAGGQNQLVPDAALVGMGSAALFVGWPAEKQRPELSRNLELASGRRINKTNANITFRAEPK